jgi:hypothetical protein
MQSNLNEPRYESADVVRATGGSAGTLQMRLARGLIVATRENAGPGKRRLWSSKDILGLAAAENLTKMGLPFSIAAQLVEQAASGEKWPGFLTRCLSGKTREFYFVVTVSEVSLQMIAEAYVPVIGEKNNVLAIANLYSDTGRGFLVGESNSEEVIESAVRPQPPVGAAIFDIGPQMTRAAKTLNEIDSLRTM